MSYGNGYYYTNNCKLCRIFTFSTNFLDPLHTQSKNSTVVCRQLGHSVQNLNFKAPHLFTYGIHRVQVWQKRGSNSMSNIDSLKQYIVNSCDQPGLRRSRRKCASKPWDDYDCAFNDVKIQHCMFKSFHSDIQTL